MLVQNLLGALELYDLENISKGFGEAKTEQKLLIHEVEVEYGTVFLYHRNMDLDL